MSVLDLLELPSPHVPYTRVPLPPTGLTLGGPRADLEVQPIWGSVRVQLVGGRAQHRGGGGPSTVDAYDGGILQIDLGAVSGLWVRATAETTPSLGWPDLPACRAAEKAAPGPAAVQVLSDALLEQGHAFGHRLRGDGDERAALGHFAVLRDFGEVELEFLGGVVDRAVVRGGTRGVRSFAGHALLKLVRTLDLVAFDPGDALNGLAVGTLPWLQTLRIHHVDGKRQRGLLKKVKALQAAWPRAQVECLPQAPLGLETRGHVEPLPADRAIELDAPPPRAGALRVIDRFVRWSNSVPLLGLASGALVFNGRPLTRPPRAITWGIPLKAGDVFSIDGLERRVVALQ